MSVFSHPLGNYKPFIVYATDAPSFPSDEIWPYDPFLTRKRSLYGRRPGGLLRLLRPVTVSVEELHGSLIVMSAGYLSPDDSNEGAGAEQREMCVQGVLNTRHCVGDRFAEKVVAGLIGPEDRVTMLRYVSLDEVREYLATIREAGFEVIETGDVTPGIDSSYALCRGTGRMLESCQWLDHVTGFMPFFLHASRGPQSRFESSVLAAALSQTDPQIPEIELVEQIQRRPQDAEEILGQGYVYVGTTDPDGYSLHIIRQDPDTSGLQDLFREASEEVGFALFDAGSLSEPDSEGHYFTEFRFWDQHMPIPEHWRHVL